MKQSVLLRQSLESLRSDTIETCLISGRVTLTSITGYAERGTMRKYGANERLVFGAWIAVVTVALARLNNCWSCSYGLGALLKSHNYKEEG